MNILGVPSPQMLSFRPKFARSQRVNEAEESAVSSSAFGRPVEPRANRGPHPQAFVDGVIFSPGNRRSNYKWASAPGLFLASPRSVSFLMEDTVPLLGPAVERFDRLAARNEEPCVTLRIYPSNWCRFSCHSNSNPRPVIFVQSGTS